MTDVTGPTKDTRTPAEKALDAAAIIGSLKYEGYVQTAEAETVHERADRGEITNEEAIEIFRQQGLARERNGRARKRSSPR
jgi:hypothetical protein